jgi:hypothetical protein
VLRLLFLRLPCLLGAGVVYAKLLPVMLEAMEAVDQQCLNGALQQHADTWGATTSDSQLCLIWQHTNSQLVGRGASVQPQGVPQYDSAARHES